MDGYIFSGSPSMALALPQLLLLLAAPCLSVPRFEVYWESEGSFLYNDDEFPNPWYIDLGDISVGPPGYIGGPNVVTIHSADYCTFGCQENWPDEFCSKYPPEGVPAKPRTVDDWGTKFNITANMMRDGIDKIHAAGGKVNLAYGGRRMDRDADHDGYLGQFFGISAEIGGGSSTYYEDGPQAMALAERIVKNVEDWYLDGVDFFFTGPQNSIQYYTTASQYVPGPGGVFCTTTWSLRLSEVCSLLVKPSHTQPLMQWTLCMELVMTTAMLMTMRPRAL